MLDSFFGRFSPHAEAVYQKVVKPYEGLLVAVLVLAIADAVIFLLCANHPWSLIEFPVSLSLAIAAGWLCSRLLKQVFDIYILDAVLSSRRKIDTELLIIAKLLANFSIVVITIILFAESHKINIFGLLASLWIGGLAVAFAAQRILAQLLGGIVIYLDRPFVVGGCIGLPDGTFGTVESIGLRSTKIRTSDKGTLVVVPNSSLTQVNIDNFIGAKKVMTLNDLNFYPAIPKPVLFLLLILLSLLRGRYTSGVFRLIIRRFSPQQVTSIYENLIDPVKNLFRVTGTFIFISVSLTLMEEHQLLYKLINPVVYLGVIVSEVWLISRLVRQFIRLHKIDLRAVLGREFGDLLSVFETLVNVGIGFVAVLAFAPNQQFHLIGLIASLAIGGLAVAFAAHKILEQLLSTIVLYLERPFVPGDCIRLPSSSYLPGGLLGRVESIGWRSTKIRTGATSTLYIVPNSLLTNVEIEQSILGIGDW